MHPVPDFSTFFFFNDTATTEIYTLSLHDALPIWQAYPGPWHLRNDAPLPEGITERLRALIEAEALDKDEDLHWFRFFVGQNNGDFTIEALKDNQKWPSAEALLRGQDWPLRDGYYGARLFLILKHGCETAC